MSGCSTGDQDWRWDPENQCNVVPFQSFADKQRMRIPHEYSTHIESLTITGKERFMEKRDRLDYNAARYFMVIVFLSFFFLSDKHQWGRAPTQDAAKVVQKDMKEPSLSTHWRRYWNMHAQGIQFCWFCLFALSPPEGKKRGQVEELEELPSCRRCERGEEGKRRRWQKTRRRGGGYRVEELSNKHACIGECVTSVHLHHQWHTNKSQSYVVFQWFWMFFLLLFIVHTFPKSIQVTGLIASNSPLVNVEACYFLFFCIFRQWFFQ